MTDREAVDVVSSYMDQSDEVVIRAKFAVPQTSALGMPLSLGLSRLCAGYATD